MLDKFLKSLKNKEERNDKKKIENLIFILVLLVITVIAINYIWKDDNKKEDTTKEKTNIKLVSAEENTVKSNNLEEKLEDILSNINGVR